MFNLADSFLNVNLLYFFSSKVKGKGKGKGKDEVYPITGHKDPEVE
jgi:hypothetical protein